MTAAVVVRRAPPEEAPRLVPALAEVLIACVAGGASVSFMHPLSRERAEAFWRGVVDGVARGDRILLVAEDETEAVVGTVQVLLAMPENQPHRGEIAKLLLYKGDDATPIGLEDCEAVIGDSSSLFLDDVAFAAFGGDFNGLTDALTRCESAGESPVAILRVAQKHGQKLHLAAGQREAGTRMDPQRLGVHWTRRDGFERQSKMWSSDRLMRALEGASQKTRDKVRPMEADIQKAFAGRDYEKANQLINRALAAAR